MGSGRGPGHHVRRVGPLAYLRRGGERMYWWARALTGDLDDALEHIERLGADEVGMEDHPRTGEGYWLGLHAEVLVVAGKLTDAATLLDRADDFADRTGERYADAHRLLVRARYEYANGRPASVVGATLATARDTARAQEADGLIRRIDSLATTWGLTSPT
ncbi:hypothetical protein A8M60_00895 [Nocardia farcinica]|nr:hypothetical protein A8M60_00895 [Nocardia farcinica]